MYLLKSTANQKGILVFPLFFRLLTVILYLRAYSYYSLKKEISLVERKAGRAGHG